MELPAHMQITSTVTNLNIHNVFLIVSVIACLNFPQLEAHCLVSLPIWRSETNRSLNFKLETFRAWYLSIAITLCWSLLSVVCYVLECWMTFWWMVIIFIFPVHIKLMWIQTCGLFMSLKDGSIPTLFLHLTLSPASTEHFCYHVTAVNVLPVKPVKSSACYYGTIL